MNTLIFQYSKISTSNFFGGPVDARAYTHTLYRLGNTSEVLKVIQNKNEAHHFIHFVNRDSILQVLAGLYKVKLYKRN